MELRLSGVGDFLKIWKKDFLGQQGFFIPGDKNFALGQEFTLSISIEGESWGSAQVLPVWSNQFGPVSADTPRGTFLRLIRAEKSLQQRIDSVSP